MLSSLTSTCTDDVVRQHHNLRVYDGFCGPALPAGGRLHRKVPLLAFSQVRDDTSFLYLHELLVPRTGHITIHTILHVTIEPRVSSALPIWRLVIIDPRSRTHKAEEDVL